MSDRRTLDSTWRQVVRFAGGDPDKLLGPSHEEMLRSRAPEPAVPDVYQKTARLNSRRFTQDCDCRLMDVTVIVKPETCVRNCDE